MVGISTTPSILTSQLLCWDAMAHETDDQRVHLTPFPQQWFFRVEDFQIVTAFAHKIDSYLTKRRIHNNGITLCRKIFVIPAFVYWIYTMMKAISFVDTTTVMSLHEPFLSTQWHSLKTIHILIGRPSTRSLSLPSPVLRRKERQPTVFGIQCYCDIFHSSATFIFPSVMLFNDILQTKHNSTTSHSFFSST